MVRSFLTELTKLDDVKSMTYLTHYLKKWRQKVIVFIGTKITEPWVINWIVLVSPVILFDW
jgi:hypothetical protein